MQVIREGSLEEVGFPVALNNFRLLVQHLSIQRPLCARPWATEMSDLRSQSSWCSLWGEDIESANYLLKEELPAGTAEAEGNVGGNEGHLCLGTLRGETRRKGIPG